MNTIAEIRTPNVIHYGIGSISKLKKEVKHLGGKALLISDKPLHDLGYVSKIQQLLHEAKVEAVVYLGVDSETKDIHVAESLTLFQEKQCQFIIALGGGSCIDAAKAVAVSARNNVELYEYIGNARMIENEPVPVIAIPTTAGTGSEVTDALVVTHTAKNIKMMIKQPSIMPKIAIVDPMLTISAPKMITVATGIDALCHALEAFISRKANPISSTLALSSISLIAKHIGRVYQDGEDLEARSQLALASMQAGVAFSNASVCLVHGMSRPIGALFKVPHGISNAMLLSPILDYSEANCVKELAQIGRSLQENVRHSSDEAAASAAVMYIKRLCKELQIPNLKTWGIKETDFEASLEKMADDALASGSPGNHPIIPSKEEIIGLYRTAFSYDYEGLALQSNG